MVKLKARCALPYAVSLTLSALRCLPYAYAVSLRQKAQADFVVAALFCSILVIQ